MTRSWQMNVTEPLDRMTRSWQINVIEPFERMNREWETGLTRRLERMTRSWQMNVTEPLDRMTRSWQMNVTEPLERFSALHSAQLEHLLQRLQDVDWDAIATRLREAEARSDLVDTSEREWLTPAQATLFILVLQAIARFEDAFFSVVGAPVPEPVRQARDLLLALAVLLWYMHSTKA